LAVGSHAGRAGWRERSRQAERRQRAAGWSVAAEVNGGKDVRSRRGSGKTEVK